MAAKEKVSITELRKTIKGLEKSLKTAKKEKETIAETIKYLTSEVRMHNKLLTAAKRKK